MLAADLVALVGDRDVRRALGTAVGDELDGWRVCWLGGWDKSHLFYWVMIVRLEATLDPNRTALVFLCNDPCESE